MNQALQLGLKTFINLPRFVFRFIYLFFYNILFNIELLFFFFLIILLDSHSLVADKTKHREKLIKI